MLTRVWGATSAAVGGLVLVLLVVYGIEYGTWIDEVGPLPITPPTVVLPLIMGVLAGMLLLGGIVVARHPVRDCGVGRSPNPARTGYRHVCVPDRAGAPTLHLPSDVNRSLRAASAVPPRAGRTEVTAHVVSRWIRWAAVSGPTEGSFAPVATLRASSAR